MQHSADRNQCRERNIIWDFPETNVKTVNIKYKRPYLSYSSRKQAPIFCWILWVLPLIIQTRQKPIQEKKMSKLSSQISQLCHEKVWILLFIQKPIQIKKTSNIRGWSHRFSRQSKLKFCWGKEWVKPLFIQLKPM